METKARSWVKSIVWRVMGIAILPLIMWLVYTIVGKDFGAITFWTTVIFHTVRILLYYVHERIWIKIKWGAVTKI